jgi:hypothetical protein
MVRIWVEMVLVMEDGPCRSCKRKERKERMGEWRKMERESRDGGGRLQPPFRSRE